MIIRKPYAILIKNFKLIHAIIFAVMVYLAYKTWMISSFFGDYFANGENVMGQEITNGLFSNFLYIMVILVVLGLITALVLMVTKKKPIKYYILGIISYVVIFIIFNVDNSIMSQMEIEQFSARTIRAISDITNVTIAIQLTMCILTFIRATGFNIQQFDFEKDLQELNITEEDREEVEVGFDLDSGKLARKFRKRIRHAKYVYLENKLACNIIVAVCIILLGYGIYSKVGVSEKKYKQGSEFYTSNFIMNIENSYITNTNYKLEKLPQGKTVVILRFKIKNIYTTPVKFETARAALRVGDNSYYPTNKYMHNMLNFGNVYDNQKINSKETYYVLCYEVPSNYLNKKMTFKYVDDIMGNKKKKEVTYVNVKLSPQNLIDKKTEKTYKLGDTIDFKDSTLNGITLKINSFDIQKEYKLFYNFCAKAGECYQSYEYLKAKTLKNYDEVILKVDINYSNTNKYNNATIEKLINSSSKIEYIIDGKKKYMENIKDVKPSKAEKGNYLYFEAIDEISTATNINLVFEIKNIKYIYNLKK